MPRSLRDPVAVGTRAGILALWLHEPQGYRHPSLRRYWYAELRFVHRMGRVNGPAGENVSGKLPATLDHPSSAADHAEYRRRCALVCWQSDDDRHSYPVCGWDTKFHW